MGGLLTYSGLAAKIKAMRGTLLTNREYQEMASLETVADAVEFLKHQPAYTDIFANAEDSSKDASLHRGAIEELLTFSQYRDFTKLYRFSNLVQRKFLDLYFMHYEIVILKRCLRNAMDHRRNVLDLSKFQDFFERHSTLDLIKLSASENLEDFISNLNGSIYYPIMTALSDHGKPTLFDYETSLDLAYFKSIWKIKNKYLSKAEQKTMLQCFGSRLDMLNIQWIYRSKKYYQLDSADIYAMLIPNTYRLKKDDITRLTESGSIDEFFHALENTYYGRMFSAAAMAEHPDLESLSQQVLDRIHTLTSQKSPYSIACLNSYLYFKEEEQHKIIMAIEGIRYNLGAGEILRLVLPTE